MAARTFYCGEFVCSRTVNCATFAEKNKKAGGDFVCSRTRNCRFAVVKQPFHRRRSLCRMDNPAVCFP